MIKIQRAISIKLKTGYRQFDALRLPRKFGQYSKTVANFNKFLELKNGIQLTFTIKKKKRFDGLSASFIE
jgi:hypothetical protein